ncbi:unnamed protein product [Sphagnum balticum]
MVTLLHQRYNSTALSFVSNFERIGLAQDIVHTSLRSAGDPGETISVSSPDQSTDSSQDLCSETKCAKLQLKEEQYRSRHTGSCYQASCYEVVADPNEIHTILTGPGDSFPIICPRLDLDNSSQRIDLTTYRSGLRYVAISHVWSDGLGNVCRNAIPSCQLYRLSRLAYEVSGQDLGSAYFWLDTICVPPDQARDDEAQQAALSRMRISYEAAEIVMVLDSWLQTQRMRSCPDSEVLLKILTSLWNTRLWTLQEGALGKRLFFEFSDGFYDADAGLQKLHGEADFLVSFLLKPVIFQRFEDFRGVRKYHRSIDQIIALSHGLQSRSTSVAADEPLCLGTMLGLDVDKGLQHHWYPALECQLLHQCRLLLLNAA